MLRAACIVLLCACIIVAIIFIALIFINPTGCKPSITTASGFAATQEICSGGLIFEEYFSRLDKRKWQPEVTFWGGGVRIIFFWNNFNCSSIENIFFFFKKNGEFEWYSVDDENSFANDGKLYIKPTLTEDKIGRDKLLHGYIKLQNCTDQNEENCERQAGGDIIINPIRSARLITKESFSFKYGRAEVTAKIPTGDWLWPGKIYDCSMGFFSDVSVECANKRMKSSADKIGCHIVHKIEKGDKQL